jgi:hypothetical protein
MTTMDGDYDDPMTSRDVDALVPRKFLTKAL